MINQDIVKQAAENGLPALKELIEKLPKEEALKAIGIMAILGVAYKTIRIIAEIVMKK